MIELINSDCLDVMEQMVYTDGLQVDCIITDPPYGMSFVSSRRKEKYKAIKNDDNLEWLDRFVDASYKLLKNNRHAYFFCSWHHVDKFKQALEKKFNVKNILIWEKNNHGSGDLKGDYAPQYEMIIYCQKGRRELNGHRESNILKFQKTDNELHPTQKPVGLIDFILRKSVNKGELVFDPFAGSGTTGKAAIIEECDFIGIEIDEAFYQVSKDGLLNQQNEKENSLF